MESSILISSTSFYLISRVFGKTMFIQSISDTSRKILNIIESGLCNHNYELEHMYEDTDIKATLSTLESLVKEISDYNSTQSLNVALNNLNTIIIEIHDLLYAIETKNKNHKEKYLNKFRSLNLYNDIEIIKRRNNILEKRLNLLIKILQINRLKYNEECYNNNIKLLK